MNHIESIIRILASVDSRLLITRNEYIAELAAVIPFFLSKVGPEILGAKLDTKLIKKCYDSRNHTYIHQKM